MGSFFRLAYVFFYVSLCGVASIFGVSLEESLRLHEHFSMGLMNEGLPIQFLFQVLSLAVCAPLIGTSMHLVWLFSIITLSAGFVVLLFMRVEFFIVANALIGLGLGVWLPLSTVYVKSTVSKKTFPLYLSAMLLISNFSSACLPLLRHVADIQLRSTLDVFAMLSILQAVLFGVWIYPVCKRLCKGNTFSFSSMKKAYVTTMRGCLHPSITALAVVAAAFPVWNCYLLPAPLFASWSLILGWGVANTILIVAMLMGGGASMVGGGLFVMMKNHYATLISLCLLTALSALIIINFIDKSSMWLVIWIAGISFFCGVLKAYSVSMVANDIKDDQLVAIMSSFSLLKKLYTGLGITLMTGLTEVNETNYVSQNEALQLVVVMMIALIPCVILAYRVPRATD